MNRPAEKDYIRALGQRVLSEANDIKRTPEALADELGFEQQLIHDVIDGKCDLTTGQQMNWLVSRPSGETESTAKQRGGSKAG